MIERIELYDALAAGRATLLVRVTDEAGGAGHGEAAPLPGYSPDDVASCRAALARLAPADLRGVSWRDAGALLPAGLPAARFALESALLDVLARRAGQPAWSLLCAERPPLPVPIVALLPDGDPDDVTLAARDAVARGARTLKLKLGRKAFAEELSSARAVRAAVGPEVRLRFDANRAWSAAAARAHLAALSELAPELVEEPTRDLLELGGSPVPLALDESLQEPGALERVAPAFAACRVCAVVLKPTTVGGFSGALRLARRAAALGLDVSISHTFEGRTAFAACRALALAVASRERASGLGPHAGLGEPRERDAPPFELCAWSEPGLSA